MRVREGDPGGARGRIFRVRMRGREGEGWLATQYHPPGSTTRSPTLRCILIICTGTRYEIISIDTVLLILLFWRKQGIILYNDVARFHSGSVV